MNKMRTEPTSQLNSYLPSQFYSPSSNTSSQVLLPPILDRNNQVKYRFMLITRQYKRYNRFLHKRSPLTKNVQQLRVYTDQVGTILFSNPTIFSKNEIARQIKRNTSKLNNPSYNSLHFRQVSYCNYLENKLCLKQKFTNLQIIRNKVQSKDQVQLPQVQLPQVPLKDEQFKKLNSRTVNDVIVKKKSFLKQRNNSIVTQSILQDHETYGNLRYID